ncbi:MAG: 2-dehydropantoate 2-reductase [Gammaproteobacteria bacterium]|jgi:2-dehydropantoate 2-reductase
MSDLKTLRIAVIGAGAVGGYIGGYLAQAGYRVCLVDAWADHVEQINAQGLRLSDPLGSIVVRAQAMHLHQVQSFIRQPIDIAFVCTKSYDTAWSSQLIKPYLKDTGCVVSVQNSVNEYEIAQIVGADRTLGCIASTISVSATGPGVIERTRTPGGKAHTVFRVGELHGRLTPRAEQIAAILSSVDSAKVTTNLWGERWSKLVTNSMHHGILGATGIHDHQLMRNRQTRLLAIQCAAEAIRVAQALGHELERIMGMAPELWCAAADGEAASLSQIEAGWREWMERANEPHYGSVGHDLTKGRRTEIDYICGYVDSMGEQVGQPAPTHATLTALVKQVERGEIERGMHNLHGLLRQSA